MCYLESSRHMITLNSKSHASLENQIRHAIGMRVILCVALLSIAVLVSSVVDFLSAFQQTKTALNSRAQTLGDYIVAQALIGNTPAIKAKLKNTEKELPGLTFSWNSTKNFHGKPKLKWILPYRWQYDYPITDHDGITYGKIQVSGSYFYNHTILEQLLIKFFLLLSFSVSIFILLKPLSKKIPQQLFINPILNVLTILKNRSTEKSDTDLPDEFQDIQNKIHELLEEVRSHSKTAAQERIAVQVAHDIRSPLLVLAQTLNDLSTLPEKKRINIRNSIQRVTDIANNLLSQYKNQDSETLQSAEPVSMILESIISEKRIQIAGLNIAIELIAPSNMYNVFIQVDIAGFKRAISNLINNSIEAIKNKNGLITISTQKQNEKVLIKVKDNGCGIEKEKLQEVVAGTSFGKTEGSGLGLPYAIQKISEWHGNYSLHSEIEIGTEFDIILPEAKPATWFKDAIKLHKGDKIVVLDDDDYIHQIWDERFPKDFLLENNLSLFHCNTQADLIEFLTNENMKGAVFFLDYEIGRDEETGLSLTERFNLGKCATLVTSRYEDTAIREYCKKLGMRIIPKYFAEHIPIFIEKNELSKPVVFIDDDKIITDIWIDSAKDADINLSVFHNPHEFISKMNQYPKDTVIYIDSCLGENLNGEVFAKMIFDEGYTNITLATGYPKEKFKHIFWVKDIIEKYPPWE